MGLFANHRKFNPFHRRTLLPCSARRPPLLSSHLLFASSAFLLPTPPVVSGTTSRRIQQSSSPAGRRNQGEGTSRPSPPLPSRLHQSSPTAKAMEEEKFDLFASTTLTENQETSRPPAPTINTTKETVGECCNGGNTERVIEDHMDTDDTSSDSESSDIREKIPISDEMVFRYCLDGTHERSLLLREISVSASEEDLLEFVNQVSLYAGCSHHKYQIMMAKQLLREGEDLWEEISSNGKHVLWVNAIPNIERRFQKISYSRRALLEQDIEVLQRIAGCGDTMNRENFDKLWCWLYPVAFTLSEEQNRKMWQSVYPRWIEGFITKEEAEHALKSQGGLQKPGTFVLRFPTSRSWPHPDAGRLLVTYVGADGVLHNRLVSCHESTNPRPLQELLLEEHELSQLARVAR